MEKKGKTHIEPFYPSDLFCQETFYLSTIKGLRHIYQKAGVDAYGSFDFARVCTDKRSESAIDFVRTKVLQVYRMFYIPLDPYPNRQWRRVYHPLEEWETCLGGISKKCRYQAYSV